MIDITQKLKKLKADGKKVIGCFPLYPPMELFYAMDLVPVVLWGLRGNVTDTSESDKHLQTYTCSVVRHLTEFVLTKGHDLLDGIFMYNACDTLRNLPEILEKGSEKVDAPLPLIKVHIPMVLPDQTDASAYFKNEINQLINNLEAQFDVSFSKDKFVKAVQKVNHIRNLMALAEQKVAAGKLSFLDFSQSIHECWFSTIDEQVCILEPLVEIEKKRDGALPANGAKTGVILSGILPPPASVINDIESAGLTVVGNDIASMGRTYASAPAVSEDPDSYYLDFYYQHYPCPTLLYTGDRRTQSLPGMVDKTGARGVIFVGEKFCEYEYFEFPHLEKKLNEMGVKTFEIEISIEDDEHTAGYRSRIEAFAELMAS